MEKPKKNEHWTVEYGITHKTKIIVKVLEEPTTDDVVKNWRCKNITCERLGKELLVQGHCFTERW